LNLKGATKKSKIKITKIVKLVLKRTVEAVQCRCKWNYSTFYQPISRAKYI